MNSILYVRDVASMRVKVLRADVPTPMVFRYTVSVSYNDCNIAEPHDPKEPLLDTVHRALVRLVAAQANCALSHEFADISLELPAQAEALIETDPVFKHLEETI